MSIVLRLATLADVAILASHRRLMFEEMGTGTPEGRAMMDTYFVEWVANKMKNKEYFSWLACDGEQVVAGAGVWFLDWPPTPDGYHGKRAYIYNVYTEQAYRSQGIARRLVEQVISTCEEMGVRYIRLHASDAGRPLYESIGFLPTNEMSLHLS